ncbi:biotin transport system substrate-specific component [Rhodobium orientis]|uniref:Biotin transporter n=1 Tax=Rhodobium orientis TaxID=34017 RepID=A0A327JSV2_9HYPH|nr:biotin transporter BioY [Rhodobium orientis]MBB4303754.1 biotin transport system substrate-specific component [Rhodobium orientis]MBK5951792.1 biotin biosynthesis protein BioY [Rhodobium orientis]RAI28533.1 biotin biosynthesis protein BioY [Rhodobium orientis]
MPERISTRDIVYIALFAALTAALALFPPIAVPILGGVPISAQSMGPMLAGAILGGKRGALSMLLVVGLVAVGLPILSGGRGGLGVFAGPTAGFLVGWIGAAFVTGMLHEFGWRKLNFLSSFTYAVIGGIGVVYALGIPWVAFWAEISLTKAAIGSAAFIPGDLLKAALVGIVAVTVKRSYPLIQKTA